MNTLTKTFTTSLLVFLVGCQSFSPAPAQNTSVMLIEDAQASLSETTDESNASRETEPLDGIGNNTANPTRGSINQPLLRFAAADYGDGTNSPAGADRPSPRLVSNTFSVSPEEGIANNRDFTAFVYAWGQFLDHDIDLTDTAAPKES